MAEIGPQTPVERSEYRPGLLRDFALVGHAFRLTFQPRGRSRRTELAALLILPKLVFAVLLLPLMFLDLGNDPTFGIPVAIVLLIPLPAAAARRLHDRGETAWYALPMLALCLLGIWNTIFDWLNGPYQDYSLFGQFWQFEAAMTAMALIYVVVLMLPPQSGTNQYGPDPRL